jgi:hypothetical protein
VGQSSASVLNVSFPSVVQNDSRLHNERFVVHCLFCAYVSHTLTEGGL